MRGFVVSLPHTIVLICVPSAPGLISPVICLHISGADCVAHNFPEGDKRASASGHASGKEEEEGLQKVIVGRASPAAWATWEKVLVRSKRVGIEMGT